MEQFPKDSDGPLGSEGDLQDPAGEIRAGFIALVGDSNAGKSTLLNALIGERIAITAPKPQTTRRRIQGIKTTETAQFVFVDTPGFIKGSARSELNRSLLREAFDAMSGVDLRVLVIDAARAAKEPGRFESLHKLFAGRDSQPDVIVLNKVDILEKEALLPQIAAINELFGADGRTPIVVPVSARRSEGLDVLFAELERLLPLGPQMFDAEAMTDQSEREIAAERVREKAIMYLEKEIPYQLAVAVEEWKESEKGLDISAVIYVGRSSHKPIVVGKGGSMIKKIGIAARADLEKFFCTHVNLRLFVSVKKDWTESKAGLRRVGLE
ncbi:MAG: GTPase Era [Bdellovibrionales bacterium]|nr:GTPase Era [Bdellovibrionales bacterium]